MSAKQRPGLADYVRIVQARGLRAGWRFFRQVHLFDLVNRTDTSARLLKEGYASDSPAVGHAYEYWVSWTADITTWFAKSREVLGDEGFSSATFVDLGCGKGKVLITWARLCRRDRIVQPIVGLEFYRPLADIAEANLRRVGIPEAEVHCTDVLAFDFAVLRAPLILWCFSPFDAWAFDALATRLTGTPNLVVYTNPEHLDVLLSRGYRQVGAGVGANGRSAVALLASPELAP